MSTDLFAESLFPIGDRLIWSDFRCRNVSVGTRKKAYLSTTIAFAVWPFVVDLLYLKSNEISAKCIYSASKYKSFSFFKTYTGGRQQQLSRGKLTRESRQWATPRRSSASLLRAPVGRYL